MPDQGSRATNTAHRGTTCGAGPSHGRTGRVLAVAIAAAVAVAVSGCSVIGRSSAASGHGHTAADASPRPSAPVGGSSSLAPGSPTVRPSGPARPLAGKVVGIDPGHNGLNGTDPAFLNKKIWNGREWESCNTTGTQTAAGYTEALFTWNVSRFLSGDLRRDGARVVLTRHNNHGIGPCVNRRSTMLNHTDVAIDIHADGGPTWGRGFTVLEPIADGLNDKVITSSLRFGREVHQALLADTPMRVSDYYGHDGYIFRDDLAGLNLTTVPKVMIECGNMPNAADAALLSSSRVQRQIARALAAAIIRFLTGRWPSHQ